MESIVRLTSLKMSNIKNVRSGQFCMPNASKKSVSYKNAEVLGIYGQNGSGKTAVIDTLYYLQKIMTGKTLNDNFLEYMNVNSDQSEIIAYFNIFEENVAYEVSYKIVIQKNNQKAEILRETISGTIIKDDVRTKRTTLIDYQRQKPKNIFTPKKRLNEATEGNSDTITDLIVARKMAEKNNSSYIFSESSREIFFRHYENDFKYCTRVLMALYKFALKDLFVIRNMHSGLISANFMLPMAFRIDQDKIRLKGDFIIPLTEPVVLNKRKKLLLDRIIE